MTSVDHLRDYVVLSMSADHLVLERTRIDVCKAEEEVLRIARAGGLPNTDAALNAAQQLEAAIEKRLMLAHTLEFSLVQYASMFAQHFYDVEVLGDDFWTSGEPSIISRIHEMAAKTYGGDVMMSRTPSEPTEPGYSAVPNRTYMPIKQ